MRRRGQAPLVSTVTPEENERLKALTAAADKASADGRVDEALRDYEEVLRADPRDLYVIYHLATLLQQRRALAAAAEVCDRGLAIQSDQVGLLSRRAAIASDLGDHRRALDFYRRIGELAPDYENLDAKLADQYCFLGRGAEAVAAFDRAIALEPDTPLLQSNRLFVMNYFKLIERQALFDEHRRWGALHEARLASERLPWPNNRDPERKLRLGYVSPDLRHHAVAFFIDGVLQHHDRERFEIHCFDTSPYSEDAVTLRLRRGAHQWHRVGDLSDARLANLIRSLQIDILVDLSGHTAHNRLLVFARKPAPVQVSWFGYMNTTGLTAIDYRITDAYMDPPGASERYYTETLFRVPAMACFTPAPDSPPVSPLPALSSGILTFASVNQWTKVTDEVKDLWASILRESDRFRLLVVARGAQNPGIRDDIVDQFVRRGAKPAQIATFPTLPLIDFLRLFDQIDVALDPFPYGGGTTSLHALWMGVPIVTIEGESEMSRACAGIVRVVGLDDFVASTSNGYRAIAVALGRNPSGLAAIRAELRERMGQSTLTAAAAMTHDIERAYRLMWHNYCVGNKLFLHS